MKIKQTLDCIKEKLRKDKILRIYLSAIAVVVVLPLFVVAIVAAVHRLWPLAGLACLLWCLVVFGFSLYLYLCTKKEVRNEQS